MYFQGHSKKKIQIWLKLGADLVSIEIYNGLINVKSTFGISILEAIRCIGKCISDYILGLHQICIVIILSDAENTFFISHRFP